MESPNEGTTICPTRWSTRANKGQRTGTTYADEFQGDNKSKIEMLTLEKEGKEILLLEDDEEKSM